MNVCMEHFSQILNRTPMAIDLVSSSHPHHHQHHHQHRHPVTTPTAITPPSPLWYLCYLEERLL